MRLAGLTLRYRCPARALTLLCGKKRVFFLKKGDVNKKFRRGRGYLEIVQERSASCTLVFICSWYYCTCQHTVQCAVGWCKGLPVHRLRVCTCITLRCVCLSLFSSAYVCMWTCLNIRCVRVRGVCLSVCVSLSVRCLCCRLSCPPLLPSSSCSTSRTAGGTALSTLTRAYSCPPFSRRRPAEERRGTAGLLLLSLFCGLRCTPKCNAVLGHSVCCQLLMLHRSVAVSCLACVL